MKARTIARSVAIVLALAAGGLVMRAQTPPVPQFRAGVDVFELEVSVVDHSHEPVRALASSNFTVLENGVPQQIVSFQEVEFPEYDGPLTEAVEDVAPDVTSRRYVDRRLLTLVLDDWGLAPGGNSLRPVSESKDIAKRIVAQMGALDFAAIVLTRDTRYFPDFTNDRWKLSGSIEQFRPPDAAERAYIALVTRGHVGGLVALEDVLTYLAKLPQHRKSIVYVSVGEGGGFLNGITRDRTLEVIKRATEAGISISTIDPAGLTVAAPMGDTLLKDLAENTGGTATIGTNDLRPAVAQVFRDNHSYYLIGYQHSSAADGKSRRVEVRLNRPGLTAIARTARYAPGKPDIVKQPDAPVDVAIEDAIEGLTHRMNGRALSVAAAARAGAVDVVAEIGASEQVPKWRAGAEVDMRITRGPGQLVTSAHGRIAAGERSIVMSLPMTGDGSQGSEAGPLHVSVKVSAQGESLESGADAVISGPLLDEPIIYRAAAPASAPLRPVAEPQFARTERLHVDVGARKPVTDRAVRLLRRSGEPLNVPATVAQRDVDGRTVLSCDLGLSFLAPADYVLELVAQSGAEAERKLVAFRVR